MVEKSGQNEQTGQQISVRRQCKLLSLPRSGLFYRPKKTTRDRDLLVEIDKIWNEVPFYGYRKVTHELRRRGHHVNLKKVQRIMNQNCIFAMTPRSRVQTQMTQLPNKQHNQQLHTQQPTKKPKFLLKDVEILRANQVWSTDITYIKVCGGFLYLAAVIDVYSRMILGWNIAPNMDTGSCLKALEIALQHGTPEIVNTDQGAQFASSEWSKAVEASGIKASVDGKARWADNAYVERLWRTVKQESVFLMDFQSVKEAKNELAMFFEFYNNRRLHQNLDYKTPSEVYNGDGIESFVYAKRTKPHILKSQIPDFLV